MADPGSRTAPPGPPTPETAPRNPLPEKLANAAPWPWLLLVLGSSGVAFLLLLYVFVSVNDARGVAVAAGKQVPELSGLSVSAPFAFVGIETALACAFVFVVAHVSQLEWRRFIKLDPGTTASNAERALEAGADAVTTITATVGNTLVVAGMVASAGYLLVNADSIQADTASLLTLTPKAFSATGYSILSGALLALYGQWATSALRRQGYAELATRTRVTDAADEVATRAELLRLGASTNTLLQSIHTGLAPLATARGDTQAIVAELQENRRQAKTLAAALLAALERLEPRAGTDTPVLPVDLLRAMHASVQRLEADGLGLLHTLGGKVDAVGTAVAVATAVADGRLKALEEHAGLVVTHTSTVAAIAQAIEGKTATLAGQVNAGLAGVQAIDSTLSLLGTQVSMGVANVAALRAIHQPLADVMTEVDMVAVTSSMAALGTQIPELVSHQRAAAVELRALNTTLGDQTRSMLEKHAEALKDITVDLAKDWFTRLGDAATTHVGASLDVITGGVQARIDEIYRQAYRDAAQRLEEALVRVREQTHANGENLDAVARAMEGVNAKLTSLGLALGKSAKDVEDATGRYANAATHLEGVTQRLTASILALRSNETVNASGLFEQIADAGTAIDEASRALLVDLKMLREQEARLREARQLLIQHLGPRGAGPASAHPAQGTIPSHPER